MAVDPTQMPVPNTMQKQNMGVMPDPLTSALNAFLTQMSGTNYGMNQAATSYGPPRTVGGEMPGGMMMNVAGRPPVPEANPMFHPQSPLEYDLGALLRGSEPATAVPASMMAMGEIPDNPETPATPNVPAIKPPIPSKKPQPPAQKGNAPTGPKQVSPPKTPQKKKRMLASE